MNSNCIAGCLDAEAPVKVIRFAKLLQWAEADAEFLKRVSMKEKRETQTGRSPLINSQSSDPVGHESYASSPRQRYLRSYTFRRKKETVADKTKKWLKAVNTESKRRSDISGSCSFLKGVFKFLLVCVIEVDVHEH
ncbi:uncharacterized protein LOC132186477 [Corylus avellana]|uniref:uncharacterized protein LOC132186477 n=1 Tax=Corylus avellana TaxID=13451 RepID=UPI001E23A774|nr:uncharacterized protein LOC132186477 [Corylus avellana]